MRLRRYERWRLFVLLGCISTIIMPVAVARGAANPPTAAAKDREMHRLLTESPRDWSQLLLSQGASTEVRNNRRQTPLITGAEQGNLDLVEFLLANHADIHAVDAEGNTALHAAAFHGRVQVIELLLRHGAQTRVQNDLGFSPLHQAVRRFWEIPGETRSTRVEHQKQSVLLLLAHDADPDLRDSAERTAAVLAKENDNAALADLLSSQTIHGIRAGSPSPSPSAPPTEGDAASSSLPSSSAQTADAPSGSEPEVRQRMESTAPQESSRPEDSLTRSEEAGEDRTITHSSEADLSEPQPPSNETPSPSAPAAHPYPPHPAPGRPRRRLPRRYQILAVQTPAQPLRHPTPLPRS